MTSHPPRRSLAVLVSATLLASLAAATVASPASAAKPKCQGKTATIVGTQKADVIRGTAKRDIIVAKGGNDRIYAKAGNDVVCAGGGNDVVYGGTGADRLWGQLGHDRHFGNAGPDFLAGQVGNDRLAGGIGVDTCFQGTGAGSVSTCERPATPAPPPPPDSDGDGLPDNVDACPTEGDQGYGVDATGCPNIPDLCTYLNDPSLDGTYASHSVTLRSAGLGEQAYWTLLGGGTFSWSRSATRYDDGSSSPGTEIGPTTALATGSGLKPGITTFSWATTSGVAEPWDISCVIPT